MTVDDRKLPSFSVIVPTFNRPLPLARCLKALAALDYPRPRLEVIVVDDGGAIDVGPVGNRFRREIELKVLRQANAGPAAARNAGSELSRHDFLAFTDDDCAPRPDWLRELATTLMCNPGALVGGRCRNALPDNPYTTVSQTIIDVVHAHFNRQHERAVFFPSDNMAVSRARFGEIGGFDTRFRWSEDRDLCDRWAARGWPIIAATRAVVDHAHEMGMVGFVKQHFGYGRGAWRFHRARARRGTGHLEVEGGFYLKCFREPFRTHALRRAIPLATLMGVWQVANTAGFVYESITSRPTPP